MAKRLLIIGAVIICTAGAALAQPAQPAQTSAPDFSFKWGFYERAREEFWKNWKDTNNTTKDNRNFFRFKTSIWGQADYKNDASLYLKLTDEFKPYTYFGGSTGAVPDKSATKKDYHFDINEVVVDNLYADIKNCFGKAVDLRIGRQDFLGTYGEGFLLMDGTPQDGSRTYYFNAAKASWRVDDKNTLDVVYINDPRDDELFPVINRVDLPSVSSPTHDKIPQLLNTTDETAGVLYWKNKAVKDLYLEGYYIYKTEAEEGGAGAQAQKCHLNTFGSFGKYNLDPWTLRGQFAYQTGTYGSNDRRGFGGYAYVDQAFKNVVWNPNASLGFLYLSGDNRKTTMNEGWDPLFSRYPWISELYVMTIASDTGVLGYWSNLKAVRLELNCKPTAKSKLTVWYNHLWANDSVAASSIVAGSNKNRGHLPQLRFDYTFNKNLSTYVLVEYFIPGKFYVVKDEGLFTRAEVQVKF